VPYPSPVAAALSGASLGQLQYWRAGGDSALLAPELPRSGGRVLYSFRDVIALRTFVFLRESVSLQRVRKAVSTLRELGNTEHLSQYRLVTEGSSIILLPPDGDVAIDLVEQPGAGRLAGTLGEVLRPSPTSVAIRSSISCGRGGTWQSTRRPSAAIRS
jgi:DNA-binding transcriptional MerR regulator